MDGAHENLLKRILQSENTQDVERKGGMSRLCPCDGRNESLLRLLPSTVCLARSPGTVAAPHPHQYS